LLAAAVAKEKLKTMKQKHFRCPNEHCNSPAFYQYGGTEAMFFCSECETIFRYNDADDSYTVITDLYKDALEWSAKWIETSAASNPSADVKEFAANMAMTIRAVRV
jgi:transcription initiation factor IIE alpha subunit